MKKSRLAILCYDDAVCFFLITTYQCWFQTEGINSPRWCWLCLSVLFFQIFYQLHDPISIRLNRVGNCDGHGVRKAFVIRWNEVIALMRTPVWTISTIKFPVDDFVVMRPEIWSDTSEISLLANFHRFLVFGANPVQNDVFSRKIKAKNRIAIRTWYGQ